MNLPEIEKGIPIPPKRSNEGKRRPHQKRIPWGELLREMDIGDSFLLRDATGADQSKLQTTARHHGIRLASRQVRGGVRFWRVGHDS